jgi:hypothetical protein
MHMYAYVCLSHLCNNYLFLGHTKDFFNIYLRSRIMMVSVGLKLMSNAAKWFSHTSLIFGWRFIGYLLWSAGKLWCWSIYSQRFFAQCLQVGLIEDTVYLQLRHVVVLPALVICIFMSHHVLQGMTLSSLVSQVQRQQKNNCFFFVCLHTCKIGLDCLLAVKI